MQNSSYPSVHASLYVSNIDATVSFYEKFFNKPAEKIKPGYAKFILEEPALVISFVQAPEKVKANFGHMGILVQTREELMERLEAIKRSGLQHLEEMQTSCCYALQDKFWVADPDGHQWEVYYFHQDVEFNDPAYAIDSKPCCAPEGSADNQPVKDAAGCC